MKISKKDGLSILGFLCFMIGMLSVIFSLIGVHFVFLRFLESLGGLVAFLIKISLAILGIILIYFAKSRRP